MDNIRFILVMALLMISYMLWEQWQIDYGPKPQAFVSDKPLAVDDKHIVSSTDNARSGSDSQALTETESEANHKIIKVKTDVYALEIDTEGGTLRNLDLLQYPREKANTYVNKVRSWVGMDIADRDLSPVRLLDANPDSLFLAQSGLVASGNSAAAPDHHAVFQINKSDFELPNGDDELRVPLAWTNGQGLSITKVFIFKRGSYAIDVKQEVRNQTDKAWSGRQYNQLMRIEHSDGNNNTFIRTFSGGVIYTEKDKFQKIKFDEMLDKNLDVTAEGGWTGFIQHYFASAWIPAAGQENHFYTKALNNSRFVIGSYSQDVNLPAGGEGSFSSTIFIGPKIQPVMESLAPGLELTVDYSWLTIIAKPIYWLLNKIHGFVDNWGLAILGVTFFIKALFFKLSKTSFQSMAKMRKIQPKLKELQERYKDDRQKFNTEMMAMYKREKVNPLGGCLPILVQIPVFISLYWVLIETVELRQAPFALWIQDLSAQDPFYLLPIIYGITMKIQQGLNPAPVDPLQAQVMKMFPIVFTVFFLFFPSGLVLYWICNNSLSIIQQWYITKHVLAEDDRHHH
ncbi:MAG: membrane protein insertase YidC [Gammaproteobacteria bacterium]